MTTVDPRHHRDRCSTCAQWWAGRGSAQTFLFLVEPFEVRPDGKGGVRAFYACPLGHGWSCWFALGRGWFSDCPCGYCAQRRRVSGQQLTDRVETYTVQSAAFRALSAELTR